MRRGWLWAGLFVAAAGCDARVTPGEDAGSPVRPPPTPPALALSLEPAAVGLGPGETVRCTVSVARTGSFGGVVALGARGLPAGVTARFEPAAAAGASSVLSLTAAADAGPANAELEVVGEGGGLTAAAPLALTLTAPAPEPEPIPTARPAPDPGPVPTTTPDRSPPAAPTGLRVTAATSTSVSLAWSPSTDDVGVAGYEVHDGAARVAATGGLAATVGGLAPGSRHTFTVKARDAAGNVSPASSALTVSTPLDADPSPTGHFQLEDLDRGLVAVKVAGGVYVGWRMLGQEYDATNPAAVAYAVYRDGSRVALVTDSTNWLDPAGTERSTYAVSLVVGGAERARSAAAAAWAQPYLRIPLAVPAGGVVPAGCTNANEAYTYAANDASVGDLDGDGEYELVLKWDPSNAKDNSQKGCTGSVYLDAYKLSGKQLWRIDLGRNIRAGAHYTQFVVYDLDGDGKAEVAVKTAPGTRDGQGAFLHTGPAASDDDAADHRNADGYVLSGPEYLTVFAGPNGAELATAPFDVPRGNVSAWGDGYGNRVDRFLASAAFVSDAGAGKPATGRPSLLMARGYYTRATITAWNWRGGKLTEVWRADSDAGTAYAGQGAHTMAVADADGDGAQEILYGASVVGSDGTARCSTGFGHGDALHVGDLVPSRPGLEVFAVHEAGTQPSWDVHAAADCTVLQRGPVTGKDTGRGVAAPIVSGVAGAEVWTNAGLLSATTGVSVGAQPRSVNFLAWWDADEARELLDGTAVTKYGGGTLLSCAECASNNSTKATPALTADLLGDWREEVVWREADSAALRIYTTTDVTRRRLYTLMHDPQYRMQVTSEQTAYNQPPHPGFYLGPEMAAPPAPSLRFRP